MGKFYEKGNEKNTHASKRREKGFTLIELLLAVTILLIVVLGTASTIVNVTRNVVIARRITLASDMCRSKIEEMKSLGYKAAFHSVENNITEDGATGGNFNREVKTIDGPVENTKLILVTVSWNDIFKTHKVTIPTIITNI